MRAAGREREEGGLPKRPASDYSPPGGENQLCSISSSQVACIALLCAAEILFNRRYNVRAMWMLRDSQISAPVSSRIGVNQTIVENLYVMCAPPKRTALSARLPRRCLRRLSGVILFPQIFVDSLDTLGELAYLFLEFHPLIFANFFRVAGYIIGYVTSIL